MKRFIFLSLLGLLTCYASYAQTVRTVCASGCDYTDVFSALQASSSSVVDTIEFRDPVFTISGSSFFSGGLVKSVAFRGLGQNQTFIQRSTDPNNPGIASSSMFQFIMSGRSNISITFLDMTLRNAQSAVGGGISIINSQANSNNSFTCERMTFSGLRATAQNGGGAIKFDAVQEINANFLDCVFDNNSAPSSGRGGAINVTTAGSSPSIYNFTNCTFSNNSAGGNGGALYFKRLNGSNKTFTLTNCTLFNNSAGLTTTGKGGGVYCEGQGSTMRLNVVNSTIVDNNARNDAGGIVISGFRMIIINSIIANNTIGSGPNPTPRDLRTNFGGQVYYSILESSSGGVSVQNSFTVDPNLGPAMSCGVHTYFEPQAGSDALDGAFQPGPGPSGIILPATDICGNTRVAAHDIGSYDVAAAIPPAPTAICQAATVTLDGSGNGSIIASDLDGGSSDGMAPYSFTASPAAVDCNHILSPATVVLTVTDANMSTSTCQTTVSARDHIAPTAACPTTAPTVMLDGNGNATLAANVVAGNSTDNCGIQSETSPVLSVNCSNLTASNTVTLTATDASGNTATIACNFDVVDNQAPRAICPPTAPTVMLDAAGNGTLAANAVSGNSTDNCGIQSETSPALSVNCSNLTASNTVTLTATDASGNTASAICSFTVVDQMDPTAVCQAATVSLSAGGTGSLSVTAVDNSSSDNCGITTRAVSPSTFDCSHTTAPQSVTLTLSDASGNTASCTAAITVDGSAAAPIPTPISDIESCGGGNEVIPDFGSAPAASSYNWNYSFPALVSPASNAGTGNIGSINLPVNNTGSDVVGTINWMTVGANGCFANSSFTVTINPRLVALTLQLPMPVRVRQSM